jgi:hypothetical protein
LSRLQISTALLTAVLAFTALAPKAGADPYDKKVIATFAEPIEVPGGITLQPGTYVFKLQDSQNDRHIVLIQNQRENHTYAQVFATNAFRTVQKGKVQFTFYEAPAGQPKALRTMYWPGDNDGQSFMYKRDRATQIASVQTTKEEVPAETETTQVAAAPAPEPAPAAAEVAQNTPPPAPEPAPTPVAAAPAPAPEPAPAPVVAENTTPAALPQTASNVPLLLLVGLFSIALSFVLGAFAKRLG